MCKKEIADIDIIMNFQMVKAKSVNLLEHLVPHGWRRKANSAFSDEHPKIFSLLETV